MTVGTFTIFSKNKNHINTSDLAGATVKVALVSSAYTPDSSSTGNSVWADVSANEIAGGNGYTTGGYTLGSLASTAITGGYKFSSGSATWTASGSGIPAWRYAVIYVVGTLWGLTNPVIGYFLGDTTPADIPLTAAADVLTLNCPASGWFTET